jgi:hypothetical protein
LNIFLRQDEHERLYARMMPQEETVLFFSLQELIAHVGDAEQQTAATPWIPPYCPALWPEKTSWLHACAAVHAHSAFWMIPWRYENRYTLVVVTGVDKIAGCHLHVFDTWAHTSVVSKQQFAQEQNRIVTHVRKVSADAYTRQVTPCSGKSPNRAKLQAMCPYHCPH